MQKTFSASLILIVLMVFVSCQDRLQDSLAVITPRAIDSVISINEAQQIYADFLHQKSVSRVAPLNGKKTFEKKLQWQHAKKEKFTDGTEVILVPLDPKVANYPFSIIQTSDQPLPVSGTVADVYTTRKVVIYKRKGKDQIEFMTVIGEASYRKKVAFFDEDANFTGALVFHDDEGNFLRGLYYESGQVKGTLRDKTSDANGRLADCQLYTSYQVIDFYYVGIDAFTGERSKPTYSYTTIANGTISYSMDCFRRDYPSSPPSTLSGGGSSSSWTTNSNNSVYDNYTFLPPPDKIRDISIFLKCFDANSGGNFRVFLNVDQPVAGSESAINPFATGKHTVGHTYLTIQQTLPNGQIIRRSVGFYPGSAGGTPGNPASSPAYNDDSQYTGGWDVQVEFNVTGDEFTQILGVVRGYSSQDYNLMNRNCGNMCLDALEKAGVSIPNGWMTQHWYTTNLGTGSSSNFSKYGPSIGALGQQVYMYQSDKVVSRSRNGGSPKQNAGICD